jgi:organic radical activating enzyme
MSTKIVDHGQLYRLPWTLPDNGISWLEPTAECNLACDGCYRENEKTSHKSFEEVKHELDIFQKLRKSDCISIAGGDPLLYPDIIPLVAEIKQRGLKPIINSNGLALTKELLKDLHKAGVFGFTFHIDSNQGRPGEWAGKNELELNDLRLHYAEMLAVHKTIACSFNSTVYQENIHYVPKMIEWAHKHIDIVHTMVFICFRHIVPKLPYDWYAGGEKVPWETIMYHSDEDRKVDIKSTDLVKIAKDHFPDFEPAAFLNGTEDPAAYKWLLTERIGTKDKIYGYVGAKFLELMMSTYHFAKDKYLSYASPQTLKTGRLATFLLWPFDKKLRQITSRYLIALLKNPFRIFKPLYMQSIMFIQPVDFMQDGRQSMCDGCPDITVHEDKLVWSCRLEELKNYGTFLTTVPRKEQPIPEEAELELAEQKE